MQTTYNNTLTLKQNSKGVGSNIVQADTVRGCKNNCVECYACRLSKQSIKKFDVPVNVDTIKGTIKDDKTYRFGTSGDPATDWNHSEKLIKQYKFKNYFCITKLQSIEGFTGVFKKMHISVDPFNKEHFFTTLKNIIKLKKRHPDLKIIIRLRSCATYDYNINKLQKIAVNFCKKYGFKVLETRMRFKRNDSIDVYKLKKEYYERKKGYMRAKKGMSFIDYGNKSMCDLKEKGCSSCNLCSKLFK